jgi:hypothetical protein
VLIWSTSFVASVLLIPWTVLSIMGHKRFPVFVDVNSVLSFHVTHTNIRMDSSNVQRAVLKIDHCRCSISMQ